MNRPSHPIAIDRSMRRGAASGAGRLRAGVCVVAALLGARTGILAPAASARDSGAPPGHIVVVELFTSQGCSSCPPADRLLQRLGERSGVVPLAFHVDFWNSAGWKDPFSKAEWTHRQIDYERALGVNTPYTPQAVVDGGVELVGSNEDALRAAISDAARKPAAEIALQLKPSGTDVIATVNVRRPDSLRDRKMDLMLVVYEVGLVTPVSRGENGGRTLKNDYVVRLLRRADRLAAGGDADTRHVVTLSLDRGWNRAGLGVAAFLQDPKSLRIFGAAAQPLSASGGD